MLTFYGPEKSNPNNHCLYSTGGLDKSSPYNIKTNLVQKCGLNNQAPTNLNIR
jgi:hypothetical protein